MRLKNSRLVNSLIQGGEMSGEFAFPKVMLTIFTFLKSQQIRQNKITATKIPTAQLMNLKTFATQTTAINYQETYHLHKKSHDTMPRKPQGQLSDLIKSCPITWKWDRSFSRQRFPHGTRSNLDHWIYFRNDNTGRFRRITSSSAQINLFKVVLKSLKLKFLNHS
eukprot:sb/3472547/